MAEAKFQIGAQVRRVNADVEKMPDIWGIGDVGTLVGRSHSREGRVNWYVDCVNPKGIRYAGEYYFPESEMELVAAWPPIIGQKVRRLEGYEIHLHAFPVGSILTVASEPRGYDEKYVEVEEFSGGIWLKYIEPINSIDDDVIRAGDTVIRRNSNSVYFVKGSSYVVAAVASDGEIGVIPGDGWTVPYYLEAGGWQKVRNPTSITKPAPPPEEPVDLDRIAKIVLSVVDTARQTGRCTYGFIDKTYTFTQDGNDACHAGLYKKVDFSKKQIAALNWLRGGDAEDRKLFWDYVTDPEQSPWRAMLNGAVAVEGKDNVYVLAITDMSWSGQHLASLFKSFRIFTESPDHGKLFGNLVRAGVHPGVALFIATVYTPNFVYSSWHGCCFNAESCSTELTLEDFVHARPSKAFKVSWKADPSYYGCDSLWEHRGGGTNFDKYIKRQYAGLIAPSKITSGTFAKKVQLGGLTFATMVKIAKLEADRLGLNDQ